MDDNNDYRDAIRMGLRRAGMHWLRASYEVVAGIGALLEEINPARRPDEEDPKQGGDDEGPIRIELD